jgi:hypothetical protein
MSDGAAAARDDSFAERLQAVSAGLRAARVASAIRRLRNRSPLTPFDLTTIRDVIKDLRSEKDVLDGREPPNPLDETSFALAGLALSVLPRSEKSTDEKNAIAQLDDLSDSLERIASGDMRDDKQLEEIQRIFERASKLVDQFMGTTGETVDGLPYLEHAR